MKLTKNQRRKLSIFAKCLLFSFLAWGLFAISNKYIYTKVVALEYLNAPENRAFRAVQGDTARVRIEATGWHLMFSSLTKEERTVQVDVSGLRNRDFILFGNQLGFVNRQFPNTQRVVSVIPDTLFFDFSKQGQKQVPVRVNHRLTFARQFGIIGPISAQPAMVHVRGPVEDLRNIEFWETDTVRASDVHSTLQVSIGMNARQYPNVSVYPRTVDVEIPIGELTEKVIEVPINVIHDEAYRAVKLLPGKVKLTVLVSLRDYTQIGPDSFRALVDMKEWVEGERTTLAVKVPTVPEFCRLVRIEPQNIDFFVNK